MTQLDESISEPTNEELEQELLLEELDDEIESYEFIDLCGGSYDAT